jgi:hypothetical protein
MRAGHIVGVLAWRPLLAGCFAGITVTVTLLVFAWPIVTSATLASVSGSLFFDKL